MASEAIASCRLHFPCNVQGLERSRFLHIKGFDLTVIPPDLQLPAMSIPFPLTNCMSVSEDNVGFWSENHAHARLDDRQTVLFHFFVPSTKIRAVKIYLCLYIMHKNGSHLKRSEQLLYRF